MCKSLLLLGLLLVSWAASAAVTNSSTAHLVTLGQVLVNAAALPSGSTIHDGDRVTTGDRSAALIISPGRGRVEVRNDSEVVFTPGHVSLHKGVVGTTGTPIRVERYTIEPQTLADETWVVVAHSAPHPLVAVYRGKVRIIEPGSDPVLVSAGSYAIPAASSRAEAAGLSGRSGGNSNAQPAAATSAPAAAEAAGKTVPGQPTGTATAGWSLGGLSHAASVALVTAVGATAVGGVVAAVALTEDSPSPSQ